MYIWVYEWIYYYENATLCLIRVVLEQTYEYRLYSSLDDLWSIRVIIILSRVSIFVSFTTDHYPNSEDCAKPVLYHKYWTLNAKKCKFILKCSSSGYCSMQKCTEKWERRVVPTGDCPSSDTRFTRWTYTRSSHYYLWMSTWKEIATLYRNGVCRRHRLQTLWASEKSDMNASAIGIHSKTQATRFHLVSNDEN